MARIQRDNFHGGWKVTGWEEDIRQAERNARFRREMNDFSARTVNDFQSIPRDAAVSSVTVAGAGIGVGVGMVKNPRFRYIMQAVLHFPMAFVILALPAIFIALFPLMDQQIDDETMVVGGRAALAMLIAMVGTVIWSIVYIRQRTLQKLRAL